MQVNFNSQPLVVLSNRVCSVEPGDRVEIPGSIVIDLTDFSGRAPGFEYAACANTLIVRDSTRALCNKYVLLIHDERQAAYQGVGTAITEHIDPWGRPYPRVSGSVPTVWHSLSRGDGDSCAVLIRLTKPLYAVVSDRRRSDWTVIGIDLDGTCHITDGSEFMAIQSGFVNPD